MTSRAPRVAIRVDASPLIGTGHFMRCLALADALQGRGCQVRFICRHILAHLRDLAIAHKHHVVDLLSDDRHDMEHTYPHSEWLGTTERVDAQATCDAVGDSGCDLVVVDHYSLASRWEAIVRSVAGRVLALDDLADRPHNCDILVDPNVSDPQSEDYRRLVPNECTLLLGPRFALIRPEFRALRPRARSRTNVRRILVFMGGIDAGNLTGAALEAIGRVGRLDIGVDVVIGSRHPERDAIAEICRQRGMTCHVQTTAMAELVAAADLAIGAGGSATWERCCLGLPAVTVCVAANQRRLVNSAAALGLIRRVSADEDVTTALERELLDLLRRTDALRAMSEKCLTTVDGRGIARVLRTVAIPQLTLREATWSDAAHIWSWRNHPSVRTMSRNPKPIDWPDHERWMRAVLEDSKRQLLIGEINGEAVGVLRFDVQDDTAKVSLYVVPGLEGRGIGGALLASGERWLMERRCSVKLLIADVLESNEASHALFRAGEYDREMGVYRKRLRGH